MNTNSSLTVSDWPVARNSDPLTSVEAGENPAAREASERAVLEALRSDHGRTNNMTDDAISVWVWLHTELMVTPQRLRTARAQLVRKGLVESAGRREGASPTGRAAMTWKLVQR